MSTVILAVLVLFSPVNGTEIKRLGMSSMEECQEVSIKLNQQGLSTTCLTVHGKI